MVKKLQYFILLIALIITGTAFTLAYKGSSNTIKTIVIDPGHGGKDPGCLGVTYKEKDVALAVALKLGKYIEDNFKDIKVIYTRTTDVFVQLEDRAQIANRAKADLFISIHCNAAGRPVMITDPKTGKKRPKMYKNKKGKLVAVEEPNPVPFGTETYVMGLKNEEGKMKVATRENSAIFYEEDYEKKYGGFDPESEESYIIMSNYTSAYVIQSANLALKIQEEYVKKAGRIDKGVHRQSIWVLWRTSMPSVLTEIGYLTNPLEEVFLGSEKGQEYLAKAIFRALRNYKDELEGSKKEYNDEFENIVPLENENIKAGKISGEKKISTETQENSELQADTTIKPEQGNDVKTQQAATHKSEASPVEQPAPVRQEAVGQPTTGTKQSVVKDTVVSATAIAQKYSAEGKTVSVPVEKSTTGSDKTGQEAKINELNRKQELLKHEIVFKVQFATSDVALNLKQEKFTGITDADFYKVNNTLKYTSGKFDKLKDAIEHQNSLRNKGFKDCFIIAMRGNERIDLKEARILTGQ